MSVEAIRKELDMQVIPNSPTEYYIKLGEERRIAIGQIKLWMKLYEDSIISSEQFETELSPLNERLEGLEKRPF